MDNSIRGLMAYFEQTQLKNEDNLAVNPGTEESLILLRRIAKMLEASATQDIAGRQRVVVDNNVAATASLGAGTALIGFVSGIVGDTRADMARVAYDTVRSRLIFT